MSAIAYIRVSTERQATDDRTSLADQRAAIEKLAARLGTQVGRWFDDPGVSGATVEGRPGFRAMLEYCATNPQPQRAPAHVLVLNASRFGRFDDPEEGAYWRVHLRRHGWIVRFAEGDAEGDAAPIVRAVASLEASTYRKNLMANSRRGKRGAATQGYWTGRQPLGYRRVVAFPPAAAGRVLEAGQHKAPGERVKLTPHPEEARLVTWMFERYASGTETLGSLLRQVSVRLPGRRWSRRAIGKILGNRVYLGHVVGGQRAEESKRYGLEHAHPPLVTEEIYQAAQVRLGKNRALGRAAHGMYMVSGILTCTYCGKAYVGGGGGPALGDDPDSSRLDRSYRDSGSLAGICPGRLGSVRRHLIDSKVVEIMADTMGRPQVRRQIEKAIDAVLEESGAGANDETSARKELERARARLDRLVDLVADGTVLRDEAAPKLEHERARVAAMEADLQRVRFERGQKRDRTAARNRVLDMVSSFPMMVQQLDGAARRQLIEPWIGEMTFDKVDRILKVGITPLPSSDILLGPSRRLGAQKNTRLIVRTSQIIPLQHRHRLLAAQRAHVG